MMVLFKTPEIDWVGRRWTFFACSLALVGVSAAAILVRGFNYGIDFTGGTFLQVTYEGPKSVGDLRQALEKAGYADATPQSFSGGAKHSFGIRLKGEALMDAQTVEKFVQALKTADPEAPFRVDRKEYVGPSVGRHLKKQAIFAIIGALLAIIVYVAFRFANPLWGAAGVVALAHDVAATAGLFALTGKEVDLVIVAALLTIAGYSINDTIVIFDRMREKMRILRREPIGQVINASVNETLSRTLTTNACVLAVVLTLFVFGGPVIHDFSLAMLFGGLVGTYSTVAIATPLVYEWELRKGGRRAVEAPKPAAGAPAPAPKKAQR
ncbi:MAG: protein translocase subunit SecF [Elusimicrobia bacterium]|nr:protein translocase subunit SecF [Elusimicrobiota bacterium]